MQQKNKNGHHQMPDASQGDLIAFLSMTKISIFMRTVIHMSKKTMQLLLKLPET
jgi:hypothetical protein